MPNVYSRNGNKFRSDVLSEVAVRSGRSSLIEGRSVTLRLQRNAKAEVRRDV